MITDKTKTDKEAYSKLCELINSSMEGLSIILTHDEFGQPKVQVEYTGKDQRETADKVFSLFRELRGKGAKITPPKIPPVGVSVQPQLVVPDERKTLHFRLPDDVLKELQYLSRTSLWNPDDLNDLRVGSIAKRLLTNYIKEIKDTPIENINPSCSIKGDYKTKVSLPKNTVKFIENMVNKTGFSINHVVAVLLRRALKRDEGDTPRIDFVPELVTVQQPIPERPSNRRKFPCLLDLCGTSKFLKELKKAAFQSSRSISQFVCDAVSELAENSESILRPKHGSRKRIVGEYKRYNVRVLEQTREETKRLSKTYKMPRENIVYEAIMSQLKKTNKNAGDSIEDERTPLRKNTYIRFGTYVPNDVIDILTRETPKGMQFTKFARSVVLEELHLLNGEAIVAERFSAKKHKGFKLIYISLPLWSKEMFDQALMGEKVDSPAALVRELLTRWVVKHKEQ